MMTSLPSRVGRSTLWTSNKTPPYSPRPGFSPGRGFKILEATVPDDMAMDHIINGCKDRSCSSCFPKPSHQKKDKKDYTDYEREREDGFDFGSYTDIDD